MIEGEIAKSATTIFVGIISKTSNKCHVVLYVAINVTIS